jgi:hypothetical protein
VTICPPYSLLLGTATWNTIPCRLYSHLVWDPMSISCVCCHKLLYTQWL